VLKLLQRSQVHWLLPVFLINVTVTVVGLLMIGQTGVTSLLRPMPGVVFATVLCFGWRGVVFGGAGVMAGYAITVGFGWPISYQSPVTVLSVATLVGSLLVQSQLQVWLLRRFEALAGGSFHPLTGILFAAPLGGVVLPTVMSLVLLQQHAMPPVPITHFWMVVYTGPVLSLLTIYPLAWVLRRRLRDDAVSGQGGLITGLLLVVALAWLRTYSLQINSLELERSTANARFGGVGDVLHGEVEAIELMSISLRQSVRGSDPDHNVFDRLAAEFMARDPSISGFALAESVSPPGQRAFEEGTSLRVGQPVRIALMRGAGLPVPGAIEQDEVVVSRVSPELLSGRMLGQIGRASCRERVS
jgi:hypothetical protein